MNDGRRGQSWRYGDDRSGYLFVVLESRAGDTIHQVMILDALGLWSRVYKAGQTTELYEVTSFERTDHFHRLA